MKKWIMILLSLVFANSVVAEQIYKATDAEGNITFSDKPIPKAHQQEILNVQPQPMSDPKVSAERYQKLMEADKKLTEQLNETEKHYKELNRRLQQAYNELDDAKDRLITATEEWIASKTKIIGIPSGNVAGRAAKAADPLIAKRRVEEANKQVISAQAKLEQIQQESNKHQG